MYFCISVECLEGLVLGGIDVVVKVEFEFLNMGFVEILLLMIGVVVWSEVVWFDNFGIEVDGDVGDGIFEFVEKGCDVEGEVWMFDVVINFGIG